MIRDHNDHVGTTMIGRERPRPLFSQCFFFFFFERFGIYFVYLLVGLNSTKLLTVKVLVFTLKSALKRRKHRINWKTTM